MNLMTSSRFDGGAAPKGVVPRRKRHKRNVSDENKMGELTRDVIAFLKKSLNSGISMDQLLTLMSSSLPQTSAHQASATKTAKRKKRTKHKIQQVSRAEPSGQNASEVKYWSDKQGNKHAYTVDQSGWWTWLPSKHQPPKNPFDIPGVNTKPVENHRFVGRDSKWVSGLRVADWNASIPQNLFLSTS